MADFNQDARALLQSVINDFPQFGTEEPIEGSDAVDWLCGFHTKVKSLLDAPDTRPTMREIELPWFISSFPVVMPVKVQGISEYNEIAMVLQSYNIEVRDARVKKLNLGKYDDHRISVIWLDKEDLILVAVGCAPNATRLLTFETFCDAAHYIFCDWWMPRGETIGLGDALGLHLDEENITPEQFGLIAYALRDDGYEVNLSQRVTIESKTPPLNPQGE